MRNSTLVSKLVLYAALNQFQRLMWDEVSGGPDSGLYKSTDGGDTWTEITRNPGLPEGVVCQNWADAKQHLVGWRLPEVR